MTAKSQSVYCTFETWGRLLAEVVYQKFERLDKAEVSQAVCIAENIRKESK